MLKNVYTQVKAAHEEWIDEKNLLWMIPMGCTLPVMLLGIMHEGAAGIMRGTESASYYQSLANAMPWVLIIAAVIGLVVAWRVYAVAQNSYHATLENIIASHLQHQIVSERIKVFNVSWYQESLTSSAQILDAHGTAQTIHCIYDTAARCMVPSSWDGIMVRSGSLLSNVDPRTVSTPFIK